MINIVNICQHIYYSPRLLLHSVASLARRANVFLALTAPASIISPQRHGQASSQQTPLHSGMSSDDFQFEGSSLSIGTIETHSSSLSAASLCVEVDSDDDEDVRVNATTLSGEHASVMLKVDDSFGHVTRALRRDIGVQAGGEYILSESRLRCEQKFQDSSRIGSAAAIAGRQKRQPGFVLNVQYVLWDCNSSGLNVDKSTRRT